MLIFQKSDAQETLEKVKILTMEICSIPSLFYITDVKAYNCLPISQTGIQTQQYAKVRATGPHPTWYGCSILFLRASSKIVLFNTKQTNVIVLGSLNGVQVSFCRNLVKK